MAHQFGGSTIGTHRHATADDFAIGDDVGMYIVMGGCTFKPKAEPGDDLIENKQCLVLAGNFAEEVGIFAVLGKQSAVCRNPLNDARPNLPVALVERIFHFPPVLLWDNDRIIRKYVVHASCIG